MGALSSLDTSLFLQIDALPHPTWLTLVMLTASAAGRAGTVWLLIALWIALRSDAGAAWRIALALLVTYTVVDGVLKPAIGRERPYAAYTDVQIEGPQPASASFPSGHAAAAAAGALGVSRVWPTAQLGLWTLALLIASSRVYLGVHYPLDVLIGLLVGWACAYFVSGGMVYSGLAARGESRVWHRDR